MNAKSIKELGKIAERYSIGGWRSLGKDSLVKAIVRAAQRESKGAVRGGSGGRDQAASAAGKGVAKAATAKDESKTSKRPSSAKREKTSLEGTNGRSGVTSPDRIKPHEKDKSPSKGRQGKQEKREKQEKQEKNKAEKNNAAKPKSPRIAARIQSAHEARERQKSLATVSEPSDVGVLSVNGNGHEPHAEVQPSSVRKDRIVLLVRDAFWLQSVWELTRQSVERAQVALAQQWHSAKPVLRLIELEANGTTSAVEQVVRVIPIHGGVNTWFLDVTNSPQTFRVDIGYMAANGKFFSLARSNTVTTPRPGTDNGLENNWSDIASDCEKIYALSGGFSDEAGNIELQEAFEERLGRPMGGSAGARYGVGADKLITRRSEFQFDVDAEMIIFGRTRSNARVTLAGNPVKLRPDGSFAARLAMPDRRQVLPIVASTADGVEQRTVVIAVERNTKVMEPMVREAGE